jgi:hypothetical protein
VIFRPFQLCPALLAQLNFGERFFVQAAVKKPAVADMIEATPIRRRRNQYKPRRARGACHFEYFFSAADFIYKRTGR